MAPELAAEFTRFSRDKLRQLQGRIVDCVGRLSDDQLWLRNSENENAVGNLVLHLAGNVRQWIGFGVGKLPDIRERDAEFNARGGLSREELLRRLSESLDLADGIIGRLTPERLLERTQVQRYNITVLEAVYHVVEHFGLHTGQIIFATKLLTGQDLGYYGHLRSGAPHGQATP